MIRFSVSHSSILSNLENAAFNAGLALEHATHLDKIVHMLKNNGAAHIDSSRANVTFTMAEDAFFRLFDVAEDAVENFYGEVRVLNSVLAKFINHLECHVSAPSEGS